MKTETKQYIAIAIAASIALYMLGVMSGLYANKILKSELNKNIDLYKNETQRDLSNIKENATIRIKDLQKHVNFLESNLNDLQLEQAFIESLKEEEICQFLNTSINERLGQLKFYWEKLPFRLEEYERHNRPTSEYQLLKTEYVLLSIRTWILAKKLYDKCDSNIIQGVYFYSKNCQGCIEQGQQLDRLNEISEKQGKQSLIFTIDIETDQDIIRSIKTHYKINSTPAFIINEKVKQGRIFPAEELMP